MSVTTLFKKPRSCDTTIAVFLKDWRYSSNQSTAGKSKWFVGSSKSNNSGWLTSAEANDTRILHPPERSDVGVCRSSSVNCRPLRMRVVLASCSSAQISWSRSFTTFKRSAFASPAAFWSSFCSLSNDRRSMSLSRTHSTGFKLFPWISCSTISTFKFLGNFSSL
mmetsp:Transcript_116589/g.329747  ORF Transcript_116589/g.329747 Transcript_116589/m.329747 type:complete len:165 (-) Transcript_116589:2024-2518(-)